MYSAVLTQHAQTQAGTRLQSYTLHQGHNESPALPGRQATRGEATQDECALRMPGSSDIIIRRQPGPGSLMDGTLLSPRDPATLHPKWPSLHYIIEQKDKERDKGA